MDSWGAHGWWSWFLLLDRGWPASWSVGLTGSSRTQCLHQLWFQDTLNSGVLKELQKFVDIFDIWVVTGQTTTL